MRKILLDQYSTLVKRFKKGELLREIAEDYGVSSERIRQILREVLGRTVGPMGGRALSVARRRKTVFQSLVRSHKCLVCLKTVEFIPTTGYIKSSNLKARKGTSSHSTCGGECALLYKQGLQLWLNPAHHHQHLESLARGILKNPTSSPARVLWAEKTLSGEKVKSRRPPSEPIGPAMRKKWARMLVLREGRTS